MAWIHLSQNCQVVGLEGTTLTLGFTNAGARDSFVSSGCPDVVREAALDVVGADWKIDTIVDPGAQPGVVADAPVTVRGAIEPEPEAAEPEPRPAAGPGRPQRRPRGDQGHPARPGPTSPGPTTSTRRTPMPTGTTSWSTRRRSVPKTCWPASSGPR